MPLGDVFSFLSGLYFRGKLEYARTYARPPDGTPGVLVVTAGEGLCLPEMRVRLDVLLRWAEVPIDVQEPRYTEPLLRDARALAARLGKAPATSCCSAASPPGSTSTCCSRFSARRLLFPADFVGRGDMSRGGLLLRSARDRTELRYAPVAGAVRRGRVRLGSCRGPARDGTWRPGSLVRRVRGHQGLDRFDQLRELDRLHQVALKSGLAGGPEVAARRRIPTARCPSRDAARAGRG